MPKERAKTKKHKKEKKRSSTPRREDPVKHRDDHSTPGDPKDRNSHKYVARRKSKDYSPYSSEDHKKKKHEKSDGQKKQTICKESRASQGGDHRAFCGSVKRSSSGHYVLSPGKSSGGHTSSKSDHSVSSKKLEEQNKRLVKKRSTPLEPKQRTPEAAVRSEEKSKKREKRISSTDEDYQAAKMRSIKEGRVDIDEICRKSKELSQQRRKQVEKRSEEALPVEKCCGDKRESSRSKEGLSSVKNVPSAVIPKVTQHVSPKQQDNDRKRRLSEATSCPTSEEKRLSHLPPPLTFKIPKKPSVLKAQTNTDIWDSIDKTPAVCKKTPAPVSVTTRLSSSSSSSSTLASTAHNKLKPLPLLSRSRKPFSSPKVQLPHSSPVRDSSSPSNTPTDHVQLPHSSPVRDSSSPSNTPTDHAACQGTSAECPQMYDNDQEMQLVEELHLARFDLRLQVNVGYGELTCMDVDPPEEGSTISLSEGQHQQNVLIVLDTNILISHLDFVKKMHSDGLGALGYPTLLVPWVVLQELDSLKNGKLSEEVKLKARAPVHYIYCCLKSQVPRLWGQSMQQASQILRGPGIMNNDDRVLQCCLQYQELYPEGTLILCTNDKNLCSKALLSGVKALSKADLVEEANANPGLLNRRCSQHTARLSAGRTSEEQKRKQCKDEEVSEQELCECVSVLERNLQTALSAVLEEEMKAAYEELWLEIVYLKPPWTLKSVLQCFQKHWIAVFGSIIQRNLLRSVETLSSCLCTGAPVEQKSVLTALHGAEELLNAFSSRSQYSGHLTSALSCIQNVRHKLLGQPQKTPVEDTSDEDTLMAEAVEDISPSSQMSHQEVWAFFESLWNNLCHISSAVFSALHYSPGSAETVQPFSTPPPQDALDYLHKLSAAARQLLEAFQRLLSVTSNVGDAQALLTVIFDNKIATVEPQFSAKDLFECLSQPDYREKLCVGGAQLMELRTNLDCCAAAVCGRSGSNT
uniref:Transcriptional protein SWT1 n=1 Tax=Astyanax mexicanus TaxID=7994 RepID=W5KUK6_ASTMX